MDHKPGSQQVHRYAHRSLPFTAGRRRLRGVNVRRTPSPQEVLFPLLFIAQASIRCPHLHRALYWSVIRLEVVLPGVRVAVRPSGTATSRSPRETYTYTFCSSTGKDWQPTTSLESLSLVVTLLMGMSRRGR